jgi:hypothetical protein
MRFRLLLLTFIGLLTTSTSAADRPSDLRRGLVGHWPLAGDGKDYSGNGRDAIATGSIEFNAEGPVGLAGAARFNGRDSMLEIPAGKLPPLGTGDFTISKWVRTPEAAGDVLGDLVSQYDPVARRGFHLTLKSQAVTTTQANDRQLTFGIDDNRETRWEDVGRPGNALLAFGMAVHDGELYAATCEPGLGESGHVYRYGGGQSWIDVGAPDASNSVTALAVYHGSLYAATGKYRVAGSALKESENTTLGGRVFRYDGPGRWIDCGQLPGVEAIGGLIVFRDKLYASSLYRPAGFYRYESGREWTDCGTPDGKRVVALCVYRDHLYASSYDGGYVFRYDGTSWSDMGQLADSTQTYAFAVYRGRLYCGTWPKGRVYRFEEAGQWTDVGRLGEELEVMGMLVHNGRLMAGTLPLASVYTFDGTDQWMFSKQIDQTPDVKYRRAWTMAEHLGRLFCSTLPSGHIQTYEAGKNVQAGTTFPTGWQHVAAMRTEKKLELFLNGKPLASRELAAGDRYELTTDRPLRIGFGENNIFRGSLADVRLYQRSLSSEELESLAKFRR